MFEQRSRLRHDACVHFIVLKHDGHYQGNKARCQLGKGDHCQCLCVTGPSIGTQYRLRKSMGEVTTA